MVFSFQIFSRNVHTFLTKTHCLILPPISILLYLSTLIIRCKEFKVWSCLLCRCSRCISFIFYQWNTTVTLATANWNISDPDQAQLRTAKCVAPLLRIRIRSPAYFRWITTGTRIIIPMYRFVLMAGSERGRIGTECEAEGQVNQFKIADRTGKWAVRTVAGGKTSLNWPCIWSLFLYPSR
jgi:hypothetical protein